MCEAGRHRPGLLPVAGGGAGLVVALAAHVDLAEVDLAGFVGQPVDDRVGGDPVRQRLEPVRRSGL